MAGRLLATWSQSLGEFTAVIPRDYQRVVRVIRAAEAEGRVIDEDVMAELAAATVAPPVPAPANHTNGSAPAVVALAGVAAEVSHA